MNLNNLLQNRPRLLKGCQKREIIQQDSTKFSLGLDANIFTVAPAPRLIKIKEIVIEKPKAYQMLMEEKDITVTEFKEVIPPRSKHDPILNMPIEYEPEKPLEIPDYIKEQEKTKQFLVEVMSAELMRLDQCSRNTLEQMEQNQDLINQLSKNNANITEEIRLIQEDKRKELQVKDIEERLNIDREVRYKFTPAMNTERVNQQLEEMYEENLNLFLYADTVMDKFQYYRQNLDDDENK